MVPSRSNTSAACCIAPACYNNGQNIASASRTISALNATSASLSFRFSVASTSCSKRIVAGWSSKIRTQRIGAAPSRSRIGRETIIETRLGFEPNKSDVTSNRRRFSKRSTLSAVLPLALTLISHESGARHFRRVRLFRRRLGELLHEPGEARMSAKRVPDGIELQVAVSRLRRNVSACWLISQLI